MRRGDRGEQREVSTLCTWHTHKSCAEHMRHRLRRTRHLEKWVLDGTQRNEEKPVHQQEETVALPASEGGRGGVRGGGGGIWGKGSR